MPDIDLNRSDDTKSKKSPNKNSNKNSKLIKKDKSWLLLSSEVSLNSIENDDVFS